MKFKRFISTVLVISELCSANTDTTNYNIRKKSQENYRQAKSTVSPTTVETIDYDSDYDFGLSPRSDVGFDFRSLLLQDENAKGSILLSLEKSNKKNKQGQTCRPLDEVLPESEDKSLADFAFVTSCNKQNYKNSGCYLKCQKGFELSLSSNSKKPLATCRCRKRKKGDLGSDDSTLCNWDGLKGLYCKKIEQAIEFRRACPEPHSQGTLTVIDTWGDGLMTHLSAPFGTRSPDEPEIEDWSMLIEWNKPVKSKKSSLWNAKLETVSKDLTLWTIRNNGDKALYANKIEFGMVVDKLERRDYEASELSANVFFWKNYNPEAACWGFSAQSINQRSAHHDEITSTKLGIQPEDKAKSCYYGEYSNTNVWKHTGSQYRVHSQLTFELPEPLGEWEVQLVFDDGKKMLIMETPQMVKKDRSQDGQYWSFSSADFNQVLMTKTTKFFMSGAMWRSGPAPESGDSIYDPMQNNDPSGSVRICGIPSNWATIQQRSQIFSSPIYEGECAVNDTEIITEYDFLPEERCQDWSPNSIFKAENSFIRKWNSKSACSDKGTIYEKIICFSMVFINSQRAGYTTVGIPFRGASTLKDGCDVVDKFMLPLPVDLSGGFFIDDGSVKVTQVTASLISTLSMAISNNLEAFESLDIVDSTLDIIKHGLEFLDGSRVTGSNIAIQVGDARVDERCKDTAVEFSAEKRVTLVSSREFPATDVLAGASAAFLAAGAAFRAVGDEKEADKMNKKGLNILKALLNTPKGLSAENPGFGAGQMSVDWESTCYHDELAWAAAWACTLDLDEAKPACFEKIEELLKEAEDKCESSAFAWSWNDLQLGTRFLLAKYTKKQNQKIFIRELNQIERNIDDICDNVSNAGNAASILSLGTTLNSIKDELKISWRKSAKSLVNCMKSNMIGISQKTLSASHHKNSMANEATLWGAILDDAGKTNLANNFNMLIATALVA